jgi:hypothetical protein
MIRKGQITTKAWIAGLFVVTLLIWSMIDDKDWRFDTSGQRWFAVVAVVLVLATSIAAARDSTRVHLRRYRSGISYGPVGLFVVCALFFPFGLLWYLAVRIRIGRGTMPLKHLPTEQSAVSPSGLIQPWKHRRL